jgi:hypothetical protein
LWGEWRAGWSVFAEPRHLVPCRAAINMTGRLALVKALTTI